MVQEESVIRKYTKFISVLQDISVDSRSAVTIHHEIARVSNSELEYSGTFLKFVL